MRDCSYCLQGSFTVPFPEQGLRICFPCCHKLTLHVWISQPLKSWLSANVQNPNVSTFRLVTVCVSNWTWLSHLLAVESSVSSISWPSSIESLFSDLLASLFCNPIPFFGSTPLGMILNRVSKCIRVMLKAYKMFCLGDFEC